MNLNYNTAPSVLRNNISYMNGSDQFRDGNLCVHDHNNFDSNITITDTDFISVSSVGVDGVRGADGNLPVITFLHLKSTSGLIDKGVDVGIPYNGLAPDIGAFEYTQAVVGAILIMFNNAIVIW
jgi:hypothetical protein